MVECELADEDNRTIELLITRAKLYRQFGRVIQTNMYMYSV